MAPVLTPGTSPGRDQRHHRHHARHLLARDPGDV